MTKIFYNNFSFNPITMRFKTSMNIFLASFFKAILLLISFISIYAQGQETTPIVPPSDHEASLTSIFATEGTIWRPVEATSWKGIQDEGAKFIEIDGRKGYQFSYDFSKVLYHFQWDGPVLNLDLSKSVSISFWVHGENADNIRRGIFYLKSDKGYYGKYFDVLNGWNCIKFNLNEMWKKGQPSGWNHVDGIRISLEKWGSGQAAATISDVKFGEKEEKMSFQPPEEDAKLQRLLRRDAKGRLMETRAILDEAPNFLIKGIDPVLDKIIRAGFNVYTPCICHGRGAMYRSKHMLMDTRYSDKFKGDADPFAELIHKAHARGVEIHAWYTVSLRQAPIYPEFAETGSPQGAFDLQNPAFRDFIVKEIVEFVKLYDLDGLCLDYVRTAGISTSKTAKELYRKKYKVDLDEINDLPSATVINRFLEWQEAAVSDIVQRIHDETRKVKPNLIISVYGEPKPNGALDTEGRNECLWVEKDWVDVVYEMDYRVATDCQKLEAARRSSSHPEKFVKILGNYDGKAPRDADLVARQVEYFLRKYPDYGSALYLYEQLSEEQIKALRAGPFKEDAVPTWEVPKLQNK